jgi:teichuronic acid biosynthesis glycosyltransferase TuaG
MPLDPLNLFKMVSVIIPVFNAEATIERCIQSVLAQTYQDLEIILLEDGSTDNTRAILTSLLQQDKRIRLIASNRNRGVVRMRNIGIRLARGGWIAFCDADDWWVASKIEKQLLLAEHQSTNLCYSAFNFVKPNGSMHCVQLYPDVKYSDMLNSNCIPMSTSMFHARSLGKHYFEKQPQHIIHEDYAFWLRLFQKCEIKAAYIQEPLSFIELSKQSRSVNKLKAAYSHATILRNEAKMPYHQMITHLFRYAVTAFKKRLPRMAPTLKQIK